MATGGVGGVKGNVRAVNRVKAAERDTKKKNAAERGSKARKTVEDGRKKIAARKARIAELEKLFAAAKSEEEAATMKMEIDGLEKEIEKVDIEMKEAEAEEIKAGREENDADKIDVTDETDVDPDDPDDPDDPNKPRDSVETNTTSDTALIAALLAGTRLADSPDTLDLSHGVGLRATETVVGYKSIGMSGKAGIVCDSEIKGCPIYRIKKHILVDEKSVPNIVEGRRAGKVKDKRTKEKWSASDVDQVRGIAIAVPLGYSENPEELVKVIPKLSAVQKEELKRQNKPVPRQPDVQLLIQWKEPDEDNKYISWENRTGCRTLWKKNGDLNLYNAAMRYEDNYRQAGGNHSSEEPESSPFWILPPEGSTPGSSPAPSTKTTPKSTPGSEGSKGDSTGKGKSDSTGKGKGDSKGKDDRAAKKDARDEFKLDWCEDSGANPDKLTDAQSGSMMAAFKKYWEVLNSDSD